MNYKEFISLIEETQSMFDWRYGQAVMNVLQAVCSRTYSKIVMTQNDCYNDDTKVPETLKAIRAEWDKDASMQETTL